MELQGSAYVLHKRAYQNSGAIVQLLTQQAGRVDVVAKGVTVKSGKSRFNLQAFQTLSVLAKGKTDLLSLHSSEASSAPFVFEGKTLFCALYLNELLKELLPKHDAAPDVFQLYEDTLAQLASIAEDAGLEVVLRTFELELLEALGYSLTFLEYGTGAVLEDNACYAYYQEQGFVKVLDDRQRNTYLGKALNDISARDFSDVDTRLQAKSLLRQVVAHHLGGKPLKSRELFV